MFNQGKFKRENLLETTLDVSSNPMSKIQKRRAWKLKKVKGFLVPAYPTGIFLNSKEMAL